MRFYYLCFIAMAAVLMVDAGWAGTEIHPILETPARLDGIEGHNNDPDDPAIWIHPGDRARSLVIVTLKEGGMDVYDLQGELIQHIAPKPVPGVAANPARFNNVDIAYNVPLMLFSADLAVASDRYNDMLRIFKISRLRLAVGLDPLVEITAKHQGTIFNDNPEEVSAGDNTTYGLAVTQPMGENKVVFAYVSQNDTTQLAKLILEPMNNGKIGFHVVAAHELPETFILPDGTEWEAAQDDDGEMSHVEGIVVDDENSSVYFGQEKVGIWKGPINNTFNNLSLIERVNEYGVPYLRTWNPEEEEYDIDLLWDQDKDYGSDHLSADVEGLTIYDAGNGKGYLIASSQGSDQFVVYDRITDAYIGSFSITEDRDRKIDGAQGCDGATVTNLNLTGKFEKGLLVVQDGENTPGVYNEEGVLLDNVNFKYVRWEDIAGDMGLAINNP